VLDQSAMVADALATALLVMGPEDSITFAENNEIPAYLIYSDGNSMTERFTSQFLSHINE